MPAHLCMDNDGINFSLSHFQFDYPRLNLTASYVERYSDHDIALNIDGKDTDAASVRSVLLAVNKEDPVVRRIFEIIREAEVPEILFSAHANSASDLKKTENFTIKGSIQKGAVFAPKAELLVSNVSGNVLIENGILNATDVSGQSGGTSTTNGVLRIGLPKGDDSFHLDLPLSSRSSRVARSSETGCPQRGFQARTVANYRCERESAGQTRSW